VIESVNRPEAIRGEIGLKVLGKITMKILCLFATIILSSTAFAQDTPKVGGKPMVQVKPKGPIGCKMVGTVKGTKLWAGECVASEQTGAVPEGEK
jgi:hypothetical protein